MAMLIWVKAKRWSSPYTLDKIGKIVFNVFDKEEWAMVLDICQITEKHPSEVVMDLDLEANTRTIIVDPKDFL